MTEKTQNRTMEVKFLPSENKNALALQAILKIVQLALESETNQNIRREENEE